MTTATTEKPQRLTLDQAKIDAASKSLDDGAVTPGYGGRRKTGLRAGVGQFVRTLRPAYTAAPGERYE